MLGDALSLPSGFTSVWVCHRVVVKTSVFLLYMVLLLLQVFGYGGMDMRCFDNCFLLHKEKLIVVETFLI